MSKGVSQIATAAIYVGITVSAISVALTAGVPAIQNMQDASSISQAQQFMQQLDSNVQTVLSEGEGSTRTMEWNFERGRVYFQEETDSLVYEIETDAGVISPQTKIRNGNVILSSNANVNVNKTEVNGVDCYMMENDHIRACIKDIGNSTNHENISSSELLQLYEFKREDGSTRSVDANLTVMLNEQSDTTSGQGFTTAETGTFLGTGQVTATISAEGYTYDVVFRLPTGSDFMVVEVQNFR